MPNWIKTSLLIALLISFCKAQPSLFYISPHGNDNWSGEIATPAPDQSDGPFQTFARALNAIKPDVETIIYVRKGTYAIDQTLCLSDRQSGTPQHPVIWRNYPNEHPKLAGGKALERFQQAEHPRLSPAAKNRIIAYDLKAEGIDFSGKIEQRGAPPIELFCNGKRMPLARYPNKGWLKVADVPQNGDSLFHKGLDREKRYDGVPVGRHYGRIAYRESRPQNWFRPQEGYVHGYWTWDWSDSFQKIAGLDTAKKEITLLPPHHRYGYTKNQRFYFLNIIEELDRPGEWVFHKQEEKIYFWPPANPDSARVYVSTLETPFMRLTGSYNRIIGLEFCFSRGQGIVIESGSHNEIAGCTFHHLGSEAVSINGGTHNGIRSCDIYNMSLGGIVLKGGKREILKAGHNYAINNHIHHYSQWVRTWQLAINLYGVGNRIAHNLIHHAPHEAIYVRGNDHMLEFNEIHHVCQETGDAGAIHTGRDYTWRGNTYRYNYIHHLKGPGLHGVTALYLDDFSSGYTLYGNICYRCGRGTLIGGGRDNMVQNNIYIECHPSIILDARGLSWAGYYFDGSYNVLWERMDQMHATKPPFSKRYPELINLRQDEPAIPKNNKIINNISTGGRWIELYDYYAFDPNVYVVKNNVIADPEICKRIKAPPKGWEPYYLDLNSTKGYTVFKNGDPQMEKAFAGNLIAGNAGFRQDGIGAFTLQADAPARDLGFNPIPVEKIGLYRDAYRQFIKN